LRSTKPNIEVKEGVAKLSFDISKMSLQERDQSHLCPTKKNEMGEVINSGDSKLIF
jgi:hypothetical protein